MKQLRPLVSFDEQIKEMSIMVSEMQICVERNVEETTELKVMLGRLKLMLDDMTFEQ